MKIRQIMITSLLLFSGTKALAQPERVSVWDGFGDNVYMDAGVGSFCARLARYSFWKTDNSFFKFRSRKMDKPFLGAASRCVRL